MAGRFRDIKDPIAALAAEGAEVLVLGLGRSGAAAANLLSSLGCRVTVSEQSSRDAYTGDPDCLDRGIDVVWGGHPEELLLRFPLIVASPGVPVETGSVRRAVKAGIRLVGEMELAYRLSRLPWVAITGTNGKSTTTTLLGEFAREAGLPVLVGGNLGVPAAELVRGENGFSYLIAEVSSFQLETIETFRPGIAVVLNVSPDHLDRYRDEGDYIEAKSHIFRNMEGDDWAVVNEDDAIVREMSGKARAALFPFSRSRRLTSGVVLEGNWLTVRQDGRSEPVIHSRDIALPGSHNLENCMAAVAAGIRMGIGIEHMAKVMKTFRGLEHRMELVGYFRGIPVYNDSKGTNVGATLKSLEGLHGDVTLIMGGKDKGTPYAPLRDLVSRKVSTLILIGEAAERMNQEVGGVTETVVAEGLEDAVREAIGRARPGSEILFSPACSSFDMFSSFEERGKVFKELVSRYLEVGA